MKVPNWKTNPLPNIKEAELKDLLTKYLHGSGFDGQWYVEEQKNSYLCTINFHCMNQDGYYDGWISLNYYVSKNLVSYRLTCTASNYHRYHYIQEHDKDFYNQQFEYPLQQIRTKLMDLEIETALLEV
jgi:hypothetical protein